MWFRRVFFLKELRWCLEVMTGNNFPEKRRKEMHLFFVFSQIEKAGKYKEREKAQLEGIFSKVTVVAASPSVLLLFSPPLPPCRKMWENSVSGGGNYYSDSTGGEGNRGGGLERRRFKTKNPALFSSPFILPSWRLTYTSRIDRVKKMKEIFCWVFFLFGHGQCRVREYSMRPRIMHWSFFWQTFALTKGKAANAKAERTDLQVFLKKNA